MAIAPKSTENASPTLNANRDPKLRPLMREVGAVEDAPRLARPLNVVLLRGPIISTTGALNNEAVPAIGLAYIAGYLRARGINAEIIDSVGEGLNQVWPLEGVEGYQGQGLSFEETIERIPPNADVIAVSVMFSGEWPAQKRFLQKLRANFPKATLVAGGEHITALTEYSLREVPGLDYCVRGEGENAFFELLYNIAADQDPRETPSVAYLDDQGIYRESTNLTRIKDIDHIAWPYWPEGYLENFWKHGKSYGVQTERDMPLMISRGCPFQCTFCSNPRMWTTRYSLRDVDDVIAEMKYYIERFGVTAFQLYDLTAITKKAWAVELCTRMLDEGMNVKWSLPSGTRSEALDEEVLSLLKKTGCNYLVYAPESGSERMLAHIKKKISLDGLTDSALTAKRVGLTLRTNLIIGFPGERRRDMFATIRYGLYLAAKGVDEVSINIFSPYPGSELFDLLYDEGRVELSEKYFLALTSLNSDFSKFNPLAVNENVGPRELAFYRIFFMLMNYIIGYVFYPKRVIRTIKNLWFGGQAATVLEHRLKDRNAKKRGNKNTKHRQELPL